MSDHSLSLLTLDFAYRLHQASGLCKSQATFKQQSLVVFVEEKSLSKCSKDLPQLQNLRAIISFERNFDGQIYLMQDLDTSGHCTLRTIDLRKFHELRYFEDEYGKLPYVHVPSSCNYICKDRRISVINSDKNLPTEVNVKYTSPIATATKMIIGMFENNLAEFLTFDNQKRSATRINLSYGNSRNSNSRQKSCSRGKRCRNGNTMGSKKQCRKHVVQSSFERLTQNAVMIDPNALPVVSLGWSTMDCNKYGANACTIAGNIKPFLRDGNLPNRVSRKLIEVVEFVMRIMPGDWSFDIKNCGSERLIELRRGMIAQFKQMLGGNADVEHFRVEGITIVIPLSVGWHKDTLNCSMHGMTSVLSINAKIPMSTRTIPSGPGSRLWIWLNQNGYSESFPCSIILYSRKSVQSYCEKIARTELFAERDLVRKCIKWAIVDRVKSVVDYQSRVWNNDVFPNLFRKYCKVKKGSRFKGQMWSSPAAYDKTVSIVFFCNTLNQQYSYVY